MAISIGEQVYEFRLETGRKLSGLITIAIARALEAVGLKPQDLDYFACGLGPGSFTGIRIGLSTIKGLAWALKKPVLGIPTLDILAAGANQRETMIVPAVDARRNLIYCSGYRFQGSALKRLMPYMLLSTEEFYRKVKPRSVILGDAVQLYRQGILKNIKGAQILDKDYWYPRPRPLIALAKEYAAGGKFSTALKVKPIYLYPKECQVRRVEGRE